MAKLTRIFQNLFGSNGAQSHFGQFGSRASGPGTYTKDPSSIQALSAFITNGLKDAIIGGNKALALEDLNGLLYLIFYQIAYGLQQGIAEWDPGTTYYTGSIVTRPGTSELYGSVVDNNLNNALPVQSTNGFWQYLNPQSVATGLIAPAAGPTAPTGYLLCDGTAYVAGTYPALYSYIGTTWNGFNGHTDPGAGNFRVPDLRGMTLIGAGQGLGLTARNLAQWLGEETHTLLTAEMPSHAHTVTDTHAHGLKYPGSNGVVAVQLSGPNQGISGGGGGGASFSIPNTGLVSDPFGSGGIVVNNNGGGGAHNNMQPSAGINWVIKI